MDLIAVPLMLAAIALAFNHWESGRQTRREDAATKRQRGIAREARLDGQLQTYIKQVTELMLHDVQTQGTQGPSRRARSSSDSCPSQRLLQRGMSMRSLLRARCALGLAAALALPAM